MDQLFLTDNYLELNATKRRKDLIDRMIILDKSSINCHSCPGTCCTQVANSMQISPLETFDIIFWYLNKTNSHSTLDDLMKKMLETIDQYRLDKEIYTGKKNGNSKLRKNYTCPFFNFTYLGCSISAEFKPFGCLGFNPKVTEDNGKTCSSNYDLIEKSINNPLCKIENDNDKVKIKFNISWDKKDIPSAVVDFINQAKKVSKLPIKRR